MKFQKSEVRSQKSGARKIAAGFSPRSSLLAPARRACGERGIALVITLIMLSVTLIMAVAFLALSRRERSAVATTTDTAVARLAADSALSAAQAQIAASVFATTNAAAYDYHLLVSTNYLPPSVGMPGDLTNLFISPRAPVLISATEPNGRFYLDLNRNGKFETNGSVVEVDNANNILGTNYNAVGDPEWIGVLERPDQPHGPNNHFVARYAFMAQPIGNGLDLNYIHNQTMNPNLTTADGFFRNESVGSWELNLAGFLADLNTNQWDLNNSYTYVAGGLGGNLGAAFEDARALLGYRYAYAYNSLAVPPLYFYNALVNGGIDGYTLGNLLTGTALPAVMAPLNAPNSPWVGANNTNRFFTLPTDLFDTNKIVPANFIGHLAAAGNSTNTYDRYTFYRMLDQLGTDSSADAGKMNLNFRNMTTGAVVSGMETNLYAWSALDFFTNAADRMLRTYSSNWFAANPNGYLLTYYATNYPYAVGPDGSGLTNVPFFGWTNRVPAFGLAKIPVQLNGNFVYAPAVNRVLQLAANLYDASTNSFYPSVFRPTFWVTNESSSTNIYINGYTNLSTVIGTSDSVFSPPYDAGYLAATYVNIALSPLVNIYGVPWIIGAKKGFPGLNQFSMVNSAYFQRRLEVQRNVQTGVVLSTNQLIQMNIANNPAISFWNSYSNDYVANGSLIIFATNAVQMTLTNSGWGKPATYPFGNVFSYVTNVWPGSKWANHSGGLPNVGSVFSSQWTNIFVTTNSAYDFANRKFTNNVSTAWDSGLNPLPQFGLATTNYLQAYILDGSGSSYHVIDYVQLRGPIDSTNLTTTLSDPDSVSPPPYYMWSTNIFGKGAVPSWGIVNQLNISQGVGTAPAAAQWNNPAGLPGNINAQSDAQKYFQRVLLGNTNYLDAKGVSYPITETNVQAGYTAVRTNFVAYLYQVNDPLVHYLASDLNAGDGASWAGGNAIKNGIWFQNNGSTQNNGSGSQAFPSPPGSSDISKSRYQPWGKAAPTALQTAYYNFSNPYNLTYKDSLVWGSDSWDFPTNRYPTVGWIGRVHRGTPWQTVYLKASDLLQVTNSSKGNIGTNTWAAWTGDLQTSYNQYFDAGNSGPTQDRLLFDLFTTRFNDNATHGTLSVNQANFAAWSAVFSGVVALQNVTPVVNVFTTPTVTKTNVSPGGIHGTNSPLGQIYNGILAARANTNLFPSGVFTHVGDILSASQFSEQSPFLNRSTANQLNYDISDELYEWLPQQTLGLLRCSGSPRYVVYCYGQSLRPAANSISTSSANGLFGLVTNYQVMAESAARAVIRFDRSLTTNASGSVTGTNYTTTVESYNVLPPD
jgi:hypothetical protein